MGNSQPKLTQNDSSLPEQEQEQEQQEEEQVVINNNETLTFTCEICIEPMLLPNMKFKNKNLCTHPFCVDCIVKYITVKLENNVGRISCPSLNCKHFLDPISCRTLMEPQLFVKWCDVLCESTVLGLSNCYCPNQNCSALILDECDGGNVKRSNCPSCKRLFCFQCKIPWHAGFWCEESRELRDANDVAFGLLAERQKWKRCPHCRSFVELIDGCRVVKCRCGSSFCFNCGKQFDFHGFCDCESPSVPCWCVMIVNIFGFIMFILAIIYMYSNNAAGSQ